MAVQYLRARGFGGGAQQAFDGGAIGQPAGGNAR
jgi:hypothetical protein